MWDEYADLESTPAGVSLMLVIARAYGAAGDDERRLEWVERLLPTAERLGLVHSIVDRPVREADRAVAAGSTAGSA